LKFVPLSLLQLQLKSAASHLLPGPSAMAGMKLIKKAAVMTACAFAGVGW
jgi:hypothetical protein